MTVGGAASGSVFRRFSRATACSVRADLRVDSHGWLRATSCLFVAAPCGACYAPQLTPAATWLAEAALHLRRRRSAVALRSLHSGSEEKSEPPHPAIKPIASNLRAAACGSGTSRSSLRASGWQRQSSNESRDRPARPARAAPRLAHGQQVPCSCAWLRSRRPGSETNKRNHGAHRRQSR